MVALNGARSVKLPLHVQIRFVRFFRSIKSRFSVPNAISHYLRSPFALVGADTKQPDPICFSGCSHVLQVTKSRHLPQIAKSVVQFVAVYMINVLRGPFAGYVSPSQSVRELFAVMNSYGPVACRLSTTGNFTDKVRAFFMCYPRKNACACVVTKGRFQMVYGAWYCHDSAFTIGSA
jgi:hypothetical protein